MYEIKILPTAEALPGGRVKHRVTVYWRGIRIEHAIVNTPGNGAGVAQEIINRHERRQAAR